MPGPPPFVSRCPACGVLVRGREREASEDRRVYDVEAVGRPETRRPVEAPWGEADQKRLRKWLLWSTAVTLGLVGVLLALVLLLG